MLVIPSGFPHAGRAEHPLELVDAGPVEWEVDPAVVRRPLADEHAVDVKKTSGGASAAASAARISVALL